MSSRARKKWQYRMRPELKRQLVSTGLLNNEEVVMSDSPQLEKMSAILLDFVAP